MKNQFEDAFADIYNQYLGKGDSELSNSKEVTLYAEPGLSCGCQLKALAKKTFGYHYLRTVGKEESALGQDAVVMLESSYPGPYEGDIKAVLSKELCYGIGNGQPYLVSLVAALAIEEDGQQAILIGDEYIDDESQIITFTGRSALDLFDERIAEELLVSVFQDLVNAKDTYKEQTIEEIEQ